MVTSSSFPFLDPQEARKTEDLSSVEEQEQFFIYSVRKSIFLKSISIKYLSINL